ncbi:SDR family NAD(P)-dependent oxidoreductase [Actinoplanes couchii]|uniref:Short-chain dehydrogenase n=1 Tax=Actinoplanes couchii TaxID=403638 RepID=A0ABQ3XLI2_9ACTN|nr:SDR family NAD(P)-dependent oxidoreductase [Actinoplanes couchii]MDR6318345.1 short-subunit dehydrogenase [Actinoplanes couchii]GID59287.1 short-chain dehydrogenase [Actinoplanes couchii]
MAKTVLILGAGPGSGLAVARRLAGEGYQVALVARRKDKLDDLVAGLQASGVTAAGFAHDLTDLPALAGVVDSVVAQFGPIDTLVFAPSAEHWAIPATELTAEVTRDFADLFLYPLIEATRLVLPAMLERGAGQIVYINGGQAIEAPAGMSGPAPAMSAARNYLGTLRQEVAERGVVVSAVFVTALIEQSAAAEAAAAWDPDNEHPRVSSTVIADAVWAFHDRSAGGFEVVVP